MGTLFKSIRQKLSSVYEAEEAQAISLILLEDMCGLTKADVLIGKDDDLESSTLEKLHTSIERLLNNEPIQYVVGKTMFCGLEIQVDKSVLIPRPETEELIMSIHGIEPNSVLDIGTGSGCIALALKSIYPKAEVFAYDISEKALTIARQNAKRLNLDVNFIQADILEMQSSTQSYDLIVSNPPYICNSERKEMDKNVLDYEPSLALFVPDDDPLRFYRAIVRFATNSLNEKGTLAFEINRQYGNNVKQLMEDNLFADVEICKDSFGNDRIVKGWLQRQ